MSETQNAAFDAAYKVAYEAALEAAQAAQNNPYNPAYASTPQRDNDVVELSFQNITNAIKNHWVILTAMTLVFALLGFLYVQFLVTPQYQTSVNLIVQTNNTTTYDQSVSNDYVTSAKNLAKTYAQILNSSKVQNHIIKELDLDMSALDLKKLAEAKPLTDSQIVRVTVTTEDRELSRQIAKAYLKYGPDDLNELVEAGKCNPVSSVEEKADPIKPGLKRTIALMGIVGFALAFAFALFREMRNHYVVSTDDIKDLLGVPVLGVIPNAELA
ncbi:MAG: hypothetical protein J6Y62_02465 [Clostridia bacterium]|nr:hypothetical protein [Clostridia bacterium]